MAKTGSAGPPLTSLKDFQRATVRHLMERFNAPDGSKRFLVADEVGLGKTLIARGTIESLLALRSSNQKRADIIYLCSNAAIAQQNLAKLQVFETEGKPMVTRLTELPLHMQDIQQTRINLLSFTPGTSFDRSGQPLGRKEERVVLYHLIKPLRQFTSRFTFSKIALQNLLQGDVNHQNWIDELRKPARRKLLMDNNPLAKDFRLQLRKDDELRKNLNDVCALYARKRKHTEEERRKRNRLIGKLRRKLAATCLRALEPTLIILDEFQRFKDLLSGDDEGARLAQQMFDLPGARLLLLSATPYKPYTLESEHESDIHALDFYKTLEFLYQNQARLETVKELFRKHHGLLRLPSESGTPALDIKKELESALMKVMCRTERVGAFRHQDGMVESNPVTLELQPDDIRHALFVDRLSKLVHSDDTVEYWKSAPYLINFLTRYDIKKNIEAALVQGKISATDLGPDWESQVLQTVDFQTYQPLSPPNARLRHLLQTHLSEGQWKLLWVPPTLPYWELEGPFAQVKSFTKTLIFTQWVMVPEAIATLCSYEAERRVMTLQGSKEELNYFEMKVTPLLQFRERKDETAASMSVIGWLLPSPTLARAIQPQRWFQESSTVLTKEALRQMAESVCRNLIQTTHSQLGLSPTTEGAEDKRWYWAMPALLDKDVHLNWVEKSWKISRVAEEGEDEESNDSDHFEDHKKDLMEMLLSPAWLKRVPDDLAEVLTDLALGGPGTLALRTFSGLFPQIPLEDPSTLASAAQVAEGFRSLMNQPESTRLLQGLQELKQYREYWRKSLRYAIHGNLQAVLDEQGHLLKEDQALGGQDSTKVLQELAEAFREIISLRAASMEVQTLKEEAGKLSFDSLGKIRTRFAMRFDNIKDGQAKTIARAGQVRDAFDSPFRPFILATTSVGQEGLDFHRWCHRVLHWNLPHNPVDLEQREGRVQRYKGHALRKNVAQQFSLQLRGTSPNSDIWQRLFDTALNHRPSGTTDLEPFWVFPGEHKIVREVPMLPLSREQSLLPKLIKTLASYRLVLGHSRQEDLVEFLANLEEGKRQRLHELMIRLEPGGSQK